MEAITDMSYGRDRDHQTRGAGAIAALDHRRARQQQLVRMARATGARDRAMASVTRGALGFVAATEGSGGRAAPARTAPAPAPRITPGRTQPASGTSPTWAQPVASAGTVPYAASASLWGQPVTLITTSAPITPVPPPAYTAQPAQGDPAPAPRPSDPGTIGGGAHGGSGSGPGVTMSAPTQAVPVFKMPSLDVLDWPTQPDHTMRNGVLLAAAATVAAYLLFFRGRSG